MTQMEIKTSLKLMSNVPQGLKFNVPIDIEYGIKTFTNKQSYFKMLSKFEDQIFMKNLERMADWVNKLEAYKF